MVEEKILKAIELLSSVIKGKRNVVELAFEALLSEGHLLIEDVPGLGKTTLALGLAKILNLSFGRIQCTSDLMPADVVGVSVFNPATREFEFKEGPVFNNVVLVDEINRAMPKTQSALLEAMEEKQITVDRETIKLPSPFFVIATQNPLEQAGTFPLPESQLDRFSVKTSMGYPDVSLERELLLEGSVKDEIERLPSVLTVDDIKRAVEEVKKIYLSEKMADYILSIAWKTRKSKFFRYGLSVRGVLVLSKIAKARAYLKGRDFVIPEDVLETFLFVVPHRLIPSYEYDDMNKQEVVKSLVEEVEPPA
ncbi:AAA family ATPase [Desulfurobacterium indicum]|uniref:AAA family ATPase n=1 Tax=Desulfurobacterium indicum TaxID=1914305 RepID=A0A1R1MJI0_9BACT|nr:AAA family ATPase [Desulfurobacterium indicum]OMH39975.1 AAA family ATPase [Desulfurobacterium indicum]